MKRYFLPSLLFGLLHLSCPAFAFNIQLVNGWNLLGNPGTQNSDVATTFGSAAAPVAGVTSNVNTVWAWNPNTNRWAFFAPSLSATDLQIYAQQKGYDVLLQLPVAQGFWVNANSAFQLSVATSLSGSSMASYQGGYSGTYSGDDAGNWQGTVTADGLLSMSGASTLSGKLGTGSGQVSASGATTITYGTAGNNATFWGTIDPYTGAMFGTWQNPVSLKNGTFTGKKN